MSKILKYYHLKNIEMPWGDYGYVLLTGLTKWNWPWGTLYKRAGPFAPSIVIIDGSDLIVTDAVKDKLQSSGLTGLRYREVKKIHVVEFEWHLWDLSQEHPPIYPADKNPDSYILCAPHSPCASAAMGTLWEVQLEENGTFIDSYTYKPGDGTMDIMHTGNSGWVLVTERAKEWIEENGGGYVEFELIYCQNSE